MLKPEINTLDNIDGAETAMIALVEYGDYQCPHCGRAYPVIKNIQEKMGHKLRFVFRNFPLSEMHPDAFLAAVATEAAARQGAFWPMHDILFENQQKLHYNNLLDYAEELGLDIEKLTKDMEDPALRDKVNTNFESGIMSGVNGTPTFFINSVRYNGSWEEKALLSALEAALLKYS